ncbi:hypothetical protein [Peribacillus butanolivorans]|uniref:hypothetical protein n=1 Tax=Peribacillus butanolivorans TaxID=421767 RepID=UPI00366F03AD
MSKRTTDILIVLPVIIAILALLLGENLLERFTSPKLVLTTTNVYPVVPKELVNEITDNRLPNSIRTINIKNNGSKPSKNINIKLTFNREINNFLVDSDEIIESKKVENDNTVSIELDRLSKNASLEVTVWSENQNNNFEAMYTDDIKKGSIELEKEQSVVSKYYLIWIIILLFSLGFMIYRFVNNLNKKFTEDRKVFNNSLKAEVMGVLIEILDSNDNNSEDETKEEEEKENQEKDVEPDINKTKERLLKLMNKGETKP